MKTKNKNLLILVIGLAIIVGAITLLATGDSNDSSSPVAHSGGALTVPERTYDFNTILMQDGNVSHMFEVINDSTESVMIEKVYTSCMCTNARIMDNYGEMRGMFGMPGHSPSQADIEVAPGERATVEAIFDPAAHGPSGVGLAERVIYLETNSLSEPKIELVFKAMVKR